MEELFASLIKDFVEETGPLAREVATLVLRLEEERANDEEVEEVLRAMKSALHTIKGNAAMMGLAAIASVAHAMEDYCLLVGQNPEGQESGQTQILVDGTDLLIRSIQGAAQGEPDRASVAAFIERVAQAVAAAGEAARAPAPLPRPRVRARVEPARSRDAGQQAEKSAAPGVADQDGEGNAVRIADHEVDGLLDLTVEHRVLGKKKFFPCLK